MSILFFHFDGTGNSPAEAANFTADSASLTNVLKSHVLLTEGGLAPTDHSFYYAGVGTYGTKLAQWANSGFAFEAADIADILRRALLDFQCHYHANVERVVLIGFSRGAALARRFAALIDPFLVRPIVIEAVMDTVASIGWPNLDKQRRPTQDVVFEHGCTLPNGVQRALHLVALDEQRLAFRPTLMNYDQRVTEVWLAGAHSDIGGGYIRDGLSDISAQVLFQWLTIQLKRPELWRLTAHIAKRIEVVWGIEPMHLQTRPNPLGQLHYQERFKWLEELTLAPRQCHVLFNGQPCSKRLPLWHRSVLQRISRIETYRPVAQCQGGARSWSIPHESDAQINAVERSSLLTKA